MTGQPNQKKFKTDFESQADATVNITSTSTSSEKGIPGTSSEKGIPGALISESLFFIEKQGKSSVRSKLDRVLKIGDMVVLLKDFPEVDMYKGYLCTIIGIFGGGVGEGREGANTFYKYEVEFFSTFEKNDNSRKSQKRNLDFDFPSTSYTTFVKGGDLIRLVNKDLIYTTCFS